MKSTWFERYPKVTLTMLVVFFAFISLIMLEFLASFFGLGKVVIYEPHPIYGFRPAPNQTVARNSKHTIKINNLGLRAEENWNSNHYQNKILFLGDSVTYGGSYIDNKELFSYLAVKNLPAYTVGNGGVNGWGVNNVYALIKEMEFLPAKIYVSVFPEGDFYRGYQRIGGQPFWTRKPHCAVEELFQYFIYQQHLKKMPLKEHYSLTSEEKKAIAKIAIKNLKDLDNYLKQNNRIHLIYISPSRRQLIQQEAIDDVIKQLLIQHDLKVTYLAERLGSLSHEQVLLLFHDDIHLSPQGHQKWARVLAQDLQEVIQHS